MNSWIQTVVTLLAALIGSGAIVAWGDRRRAIRERERLAVVGQPAVDLKAVSGAAVELVQELQEELAATRRAGAEALAAERAAVAAATAVTARMAGLEASVGALESRVATLLGWIHESGMTLDLLRRLAPLPPAQQNGRPT